MKRILKSFPLFLCVIMVTVLSCIPASAVELNEQTGHFYWTEDELIQFGMEYDEDGNSYFPVGTYHPDILYGQNALFWDTKFYPSFDLMKLPWDSFPQQVKDIMYMSLDGYQNWHTAGEDSPSGDPSIPFVLVRVSYGTTITVYVGKNLGIGRRYHYDYNSDGTVNGGSSGYDDMIRICSAATASGDTAVCYMAQYRLSDYSVITDWSKLSPKPWGNTGKINYYDSTIALSDRNFDFYIYGGFGIGFTRITSVNYSLQEGQYGPTHRVTFYANPSLGYQDLNIFPYQDDYFSYWQWFYPPTADELAAYRQQQIIDVTGNADTMTTVDGSSVSDYHSKEDELVSKYDPSNLDDDVKVEFDSDASYYIFNLLTNIVESDSIVFGFVISALSLGIISLILNR